MKSVVVDVDDTLINTERRMQGVWHALLDRDVPLEAVETLSLEQMFMRFASPEQKARIGEFQKRFWDIVLCLEGADLELFKLHKAIPFAATILQSWSQRYRLVYLTGRTENTREITLTELKRFDFPTDNVELLMLNVEDYGRAQGVNPAGPTLVEARSRLFSSTSKHLNVVRVVDDYPGYFSIYKQFNVPDRVGLLRQKRYTPQQYTDRGATRVIRNWKELQDDLPDSG